MGLSKILRSMLVVGLSLGVVVSPLSLNNRKVMAEGVSSVSVEEGVANFGEGSASITIKGNDGQTLIGKKFNVYKLFDAKNSKGGESINYTFNNTYADALKEVVGGRLSKEASEVTEYEVIDYIQSLNNNKVEGVHANQKIESHYSDFRYFVEELRNKIVSMGLDALEVTVTGVNAEGAVVLEGLDYGYYVVDEVTDNQGKHSASSLCMGNTANPDADVQVKSDYPLVEKKILEDDGKENIGLNLDGWNDMADYEIGQTVPYKFVTHAPNMNGYHKYYFAFHDRMDEELTFDNSSVSITISNGTTTYTLADNEFSILENIEGETFCIEIEDLKAIVDTQFPNFDKDNHNVYGQEVVVRFNATLNDNAALQTGRPGFENSVKLEFSNDPDNDGYGSNDGGSDDGDNGNGGNEGGSGSDDGSGGNGSDDGGNDKTGETPWDTVVCFTYKIDGLKVNNYNKELEGAKFRLYSDKDCQNEVYVKASENGYIVINRDSVGGTDHVGGTAPSNAVEMVSDDKGVFTILGLDGGTYWLQETEAPDGYRRILDPIEIKVIPTFVENRDVYVEGDGATDKALVTLEATAHVKTFFSGMFNEEDSNLETNIEDGSANLVVVNKVGSKLPVTGSNVTVIMLALGVVLMAGALATRKKTNLNEE